MEQLVQLHVEQNRAEHSTLFYAVFSQKIFRKVAVGYGRRAINCRRSQYNVQFAIVCATYPTALIDLAVRWKRSFSLSTVVLTCAAHSKIRWRFVM